MLRTVPLLLPLLLCQCTWWQQAPPPPPTPPKPTYQILQDRYEALQTKDSHVLIDLAAQRAVLLNRAGQAVIVTDVSTGKTGHETPTGNFKVLEKLEEKRSNRYGKYIHNETGAELGLSWNFEKPPVGATYTGLDMPYWMRLTYAGVGMHVGYVEPGQALSFGCIRVPREVQPLIYAKCQVGTRVKIIDSRLLGPKNPAFPAPATTPEG